MSLFCELETSETNERLIFYFRSFYVIIVTDPPTYFNMIWEDRMRVLVVDDERTLVKGIKFNLEQEGYLVEGVYNGEDAIARICNEKFDLVVLDIMLPVMNGVTVCSRIREFSSLPIIMLTARDDDRDIIRGFEAGADDYLTKPFNIMELKARIRAILRRTQLLDDSSREEVRTELVNGELVLNINDHTLRIGNKTIELTVKEFELLDLFFRNPGRVYSREALLNNIWGYDYLGDVRTVDVHIRRLREKVEENPADPKYIMTRWGVGYYFRQG